MDISIAGDNDVADLARLLFCHAPAVEQGRQSLEEFTGDFASWWYQRTDAQVAFVAKRGHEVVGMAWLVLVPRPPRPGLMERFSAEVQSVFVAEEFRGEGTGSALICSAVEYGSNRGAMRVTVSSGHRAAPIYERLGFAASPQLMQWSPFPLRHSEQHPTIRSLHFNV